MSSPVIQAPRGPVAVDPAVPELATVPAAWHRKSGLHGWPAAHFPRQWYWIGLPWSPSASAGSGRVSTGSCGVSNPPRKTRGLGGEPRRRGGSKSWPTLAMVEGAVLGCGRVPALPGAASAVVALGARAVRHGRSPGMGSTPRPTSPSPTTWKFWAVAGACSVGVFRGGVCFFKSFTNTFVRLCESRSSTKYTTGEYTCTTADPTNLGACFPANWSSADDKT